MFETGSTFKIDSQGRVSFPTSYREYLLEQSNTDEPELWLARPFTKNAHFIHGYGRTFYTKLERMLSKLNPYSREFHVLSSITLGAAIKVKFDAQNRILLPKDLVEFANLKSEATYVGLGTQFQIWSQEECAVNRETSLDEAEEKNYIEKLYWDG